MDNFKVLIDANKLACKLAPLVSIADAKSPILAMRLIKVSVRSGLISLTASNPQTYAVSEVIAKTEGECEFLIDGKKFYTLLSKCGEAPLEITNSAKAENALNISWSRGAYQIAVADANDYPQLPQSPTNRDTDVSIPIDTFMSALNSVKNAASKGDFRPQFNGVHFSAQDNALRVCATDTRIAARYVTNIDGLCTLSAENKIEYLIDVQQLNEIIAVIKSFDDLSLLSIQQREDKKAAISLLRDSMTIAAKICVSQIEGSYPDIDRVFPQSVGINATASVSEWKATITRLATISDAETPIIVLTTSEGKSELSLHDTNAQTLGAENLNECSNNGNIRIGFSSGVLLNALSMVSGNINLGLNEAARPMMIMPEEDKPFDLSILVMPVTIS